MLVNVKPVLFLLLFACRADSALLATFHTTQGDVVVELQYDKTPQTVANFITLAQGTRTRLHPHSGAVVKGPLYAGESFFRVLNEPTLKIAQTGSGTGTHQGGPGYVIRDEFHPTLGHTPHVLSMANGGPHTNGSQIFFTGNIAIPELDGVHSVFGLVPDLSSQLVIDAIINAGPGATAITSVEISRTDPAAAAFNEHAWNLPVCAPLPGSLAVTPGAGVRYFLASPQPAGSVFQVSGSTDLVSWENLGELYQGTGVPGTSAILFDDGSLSKAFYQISLTTYPDALAPSSLANRTLVIGIAGIGTVLYQIDATGQGGSASYSWASGTDPILSISYSRAPYEAVWIIDTVAFTPTRFRAQLDDETATEISGTHEFDELSGSTWVPAGYGQLLLSK